MKKFIVKTLLLMFPILVVAIGMEVLLRKIPNDYSLKKKYLDAHSNEIETLILGSSHAFYGIDPEYFNSNTFNASYISQSLNYDYEIFNKYHERFKNLKTIVLPISYFTLFGKLELSYESWRVKNYIIYYNMNTSNSFSDFTEILSNQLRVNLDRLSSYYIKGKTNITCSTLGWGNTHNSENSRNLVVTGKSAALRHTRNNISSKINVGVFKNNILILNSIIEWCEIQNVKVILLTPPAFENYRSNLNLDQLNITVKSTSEIASKYRNCKYLNLLSDINFIGDDFYDADHLSEIGAKKLSNIINDEISEWK